jgi:baculoviral IAP repeat-containing protein 5
MAQAGFYWCGNDRENDSAACFVCGKELDGWEENDDPWSEHRKHAPQCMFVKYSRPESDLTLEEFFNITEAIMKENLSKRYTELKKRLNEAFEEKRNCIIQGYK